MTRIATDLSRRDFVRQLGWGSAATIVSRGVVSARGREAAEGPRSSIAVPVAQPAVLRLDSNENPNGPGAFALDAIRGAFPVANRYPYAETDALASAIARLHRVSADQVLVGCGSGEILRIAVQAFASSAHPLVTALPSYEQPAGDAALLRVSVRAVPVDAGLKLDLARMATQAGGAGLVYVCNPNNPTATVHGARAIGDFVARVAKTSPRAVVLVDEAYHEYVDDPSYATAVSLAVDSRSVLVTRTFSKIYGMAGLRCGYAIGHRDTIAKLQGFTIPTGVNQLAIAAALASIDHPEHVEAERKLNRDAREFTRRGFEALGFKVYPSETNFLMVDIRRDVVPFEAGCRAAGALIGRPFPPLNTIARISIGTMEEMRQAMPIFKKVLGVAAAAAPRG